MELNKNGYFYFLLDFNVHEYTVEKTTNDWYSGELFF